MDLTKMSDEELSQALNEAIAEQQRRARDTELKDSAWSLVMNAKARGYSKADVAGYLAMIVNQAYGQPAQGGPVVTEP